MRGRILVGLLAAVVLASCGSSADAGEETTTTAAVTTTAALAVATDPAWEDNVVVATLIEVCTSVRLTLPVNFDIPDEQLAAGCLQDARELEAIGCSVAGAMVALSNPDHDLSPGHCPS